MTTQRYQPSYSKETIQEQDKSSDIEQQPPFGNRKYSNTLPQKGEGDKTNENITWFISGAPDERFEK